MTTTDHGCHRPPAGWEHLGRAAERFARRVADDARLFAERVEESVGEFARDVRRDWRQSGSTESADDIRRIFDDVRGIVRGVLDGVDELVTGLFREEPEPDAEWSKVVLNRDALCIACGRAVPVGSEAFVRREGPGMQTRCPQCGPPES
jgi:hypothetical protein